jgi:DNA-binding XRE family transcriptional regulator
MGDLVSLPVRPERVAGQPQQQTDRPRREASTRTTRARPLPTRESVEPLWRESVGHELREERLGSGKRLIDVAEAAGVSPQYLSEVERGLKDPSSELLAAIAGALGLSVAEIATRVASSAIAPQSPVCLAA